jgi:hypothetical protein
VRSHIRRPLRERQSSCAIRRRPQVQSRVPPLGIHLRIRRRRRLLHRFHLAPRDFGRGMGGEAKLLRQPKRRSCRGASCVTGALRVRKHPPDRSDRTLKWETRRLEDLLERVIPHFEKFPLLSGKWRDFERFACICRLMAAGAHRNRASLIEIVELARAMNSSGKRRYDAEAVLASLRQGEGIVCASGNRGRTRSSDLHEWRNDLGAVSTRDPVKL